MTGGNQSLPGKVHLLPALAFVAPPISILQLPEDLFLLRGRGLFSVFLRRPKF
jgi:hypothetical protein